LNRDELEIEPTMQQLYAVACPAPQTWQNYLSAMVHYTEYTNKTPTELINEAQEDIQAGKLMTQRRIFSVLPRFRQYLEKVKTPQANRSLAPGTLEKYVSSINSFYKYFYIDVPKQPRARIKVKPQKENMKRASKDDIRNALNMSSLRDQAIILCGHSSGMGASEIASLTLQAFKNGYDSETGITTFDMRRQKVGTDFITFISPEASQAVLRYLEWRDRPIINDNEAEYLRRRTTENSYLFISANVSNRYLENLDEGSRKITSKAIVGLYNRISISAGLTSDKGTYNVLRSHNMRKLFNTTLKNEGCDSDLVEYFMGHTLGDTKTAYYEGDPEKLKYIYQKFIPYLTIQKDIDVASDPAFIEMKDKYETEKAAKEHYKIERYELDKMLNDAVEKRLKEMLNDKI
jgi:integrase